MSESVAQSSSSSVGSVGSVRLRSHVAPRSPLDINVDLFLYILQKSAGLSLDYELVGPLTEFKCTNLVMMYIDIREYNKTSQWRARVRAIFDTSIGSDGVRRIKLVLSGRQLRLPTLTSEQIDRLFALFQSSGCGAPAMSEVRALLADAEAMTRFRREWREWRKHERSETNRSPEITKSEEEEEM